MSPDGSNPLVPSSAGRLRILGVGLALLATTIPLATGGHLGPDDQRGVHLVVVAFHLPTPGDPLAPTGAHGEPLEPQLDDRRLEPPVVVLDGSTILEGLPTGEGGGPQIETAAAYRSAYAERVVLPSPFALTIEAAAGPANLTARVNVRALAALPDRPLEVRLAVFEDGLRYDGGDGIRDHRFVLRQLLDPRPLPTGFQSYDVNVTVSLGALSNPAGLGLAAYVAERPDANATRPPEVFQAAVWRADQAGPTRQVGKAVLLELYTAADCPPCRFADEAVAELADTYGLPPPEAPGGSRSYLPHAGPLPWIFAAAAGLALSVGLRPRAGPRDDGPAQEAKRRGD